MAAKAGATYISPFIGRLDDISTDGLSIVLEALASSVSGGYDGTLPGADMTVEMFAGAPIVRGSGQLFVPLANKNVSQVNLTNSEFKISKLISGKNTDGNGQITLGNADITDLTNASYEPFDAEKYSVARSSNTIVPITASTRNADGSEIILDAVGGSGAKVLVSLSKKGLISKEKAYDRSRKVTVST